MAITAWLGIDIAKQKFDVTCARSGNDVAAADRLGPGRPTEAVALLELPHGHAHLVVVSDHDLGQLDGAVDLEGDVRHITKCSEREHDLCEARVHGCGAAHAGHADDVTIPR